MNKTDNYELTIVVPVYNEEDNIPRLEQELKNFLTISKKKACILFVDDGSTDESETLIRTICNRQKDMFYLSLTENCGLSAALKAGIDYISSKYIGYIDADLQTVPEDFNLLLDEIDNYTMVMGIRTGRKDSIIKNYSSRFANSFRRMMTQDGIKDTGCPLKVIQTQCAKKIPFFNGMHRFLPALVQLQKGKVKEIPVRHLPRMAGKSKYNLANRLTGPLKDCFAFRWMKKRYINYSVKNVYL